MPGGKRPGAGRPKGSPNKATTEVREVFKRILDDLAPEAEQWIRQTAEEDPKGAADLLLKLAEFHVPKLARTEVTGKDGGPQEFVIRDLAKEDADK